MAFQNFGAAREKRLAISRCLSGQQLVMAEETPQERAARERANDPASTGARCFFYIKHHLMVRPYIKHHLMVRPYIKHHLMVPQRTVNY